VPYFPGQDCNHDAMNQKQFSLRTARVHFFLFWLVLRLIHNKTVSKTIWYAPGLVSCDPHDLLSVIQNRSIMRALLIFEIKSDYVCRT